MNEPSLSSGVGSGSMAVASSEDMRNKTAMKRAITMTWLKEEKVVLTFAILTSKESRDQLCRRESLIEIYVEQLLWGRSV